MFFPWDDGPGRGPKVPACLGAATFFFGNSRPRPARAAPRPSAAPAARTLGPDAMAASVARGRGFLFVFAYPKFYFYN